MSKLAHVITLSSFIDWHTEFSAHVAHHHAIVSAIHDQPVPEIDVIFAAYFTTAANTLRHTKRCACRLDIKAAFLRFMQGAKPLRVHSRVV